MAAGTMRLGPFFGTVHEPASSAEIQDITAFYSSSVPFGMGMNDGPTGGIGGGAISLGNIDILASSAWLTSAFLRTRRETLLAAANHRRCLLSRQCPISNCARAKLLPSLDWLPPPSGPVQKPLAASAVGSLPASHSQDPRSRRKSVAPHRNFSGKDSPPVRLSSVRPTLRSCALPRSSKVRSTFHPHQRINSCLDFDG